jgi:serine/threonine-protein kinase
VDAAIAKALQKLPADRFPQASTFATALKDPVFRYGGGASAGDRPRSWSPGTLIFAALSVLLATSWAITSRSSGSFQQAELVQLPIGLPPGQGLVAQDQQGRPAAISPDGQSIAYVARSESGVMLHLRPPGQLDGTPLPGTAGARLPFFSPDGLSIGFFADNTIKRIPAAGGSVDTVATLGASELHGATWADTDTIYFTRSGGKQNLWKVAAAGGSPAQVTHANVDHSWPFALPGGQHILYNHNAGGDDSVGISLLSLETGETQMLLPGGRGPAYSPSGHLVYSRRDGSLYARRFDVARLVVSGDEIRLLGGVRRGQASGYFTVSDEGTLLYVTAPGPVERSVVAVSRTGEESPIKGVDCAPCGDPAYSPDGRMLAVARSDPQDDNIWVFSLEDGSAYPVGGGGPGHIQPEWRPPAGDQISYNADQGGRVYLVPNDGRAAPDTLVLSERRQNVGSWAPDGRSFVLPLQVFESLEARLFRIDVDRDRTPEQLTSGSVDLAPRVSPDGAWIAYQSRQTGRDEVWVRAFDGVGAEVKVSSGGGRAPVWATDMSELYYRVGSAVWSASVQTQPTFSIVRRTPLFDGPFASSVIAADYDVHPTGGEFAMTKLGVWSARMVLVRNLSVELQRRLPN